MLNASIILEGTAQIQGDRIALRDGSGPLGYRRLARMAAGTAFRLREAGVEPGDRVALVCPNRREFLSGYFGILRAGAVAVPASPLLSGRELEGIVADCGARALLYCEQGGNRGLPGGLLALPLDGEPPPEAAPCSVAPTGPGDVAQIQYTSGTVGEPKGVELTHQNLLTAAVAGWKRVELTPRDVCLVVLPLSHCYAQSAQMNAGLISGASLVLLERFEPGSVLRAIREHGATYFCGVPTMYQALLDHAPQDGGGGLESLRLGSVGGAPVPPLLARSVEERWGVRLLQGYGLSETAAMATIHPPHAEPREGSAGLPVWGMEVRVADAEGEPLPPGEAGEIRIRGHAVMLGYHGRPGLTASTIEGGWLRTGDLGWMDSDGYLYLTDRIKDLIVRGGYKVSPREVEEALCLHPDVFRAAVVGAPHPRLGQEVVAFVEWRREDGADPGAVAEWARERLARWKYPRRVVPLSPLPLGPGGKILRGRLRDMARRLETT